MMEIVDEFLPPTDQHRLQQVAQQHRVRALQRLAIVHIDVEIVVFSATRRHLNRHF